MGETMPDVRAGAKPQEKQPTFWRGMLWDLLENTHVKNTWAHPRDMCGIEEICLHNTAYVFNL